ncbi:hypothetical protein DW888_11070 [Bacteroides nordii]|uniref:Uncharacterized protein n=1 Tax=Bacteroides nordii TaxID=291645 RepID=A0A413VN72_9BACE|nr:hypothetical protein DW888_11070 [Bacteroides nordii]
MRAQRYNNFRNYKNCYIFVSKILILLLCTSTILIYDLTVCDLRLIKLRSFNHKSDVFSIVNRKQSNRKYE